MLRNLLHRPSPQEIEAERAEKLAALRERIGDLRFRVSRSSRIETLINDEVVKSTLDGMLHGLQNQWLITVDPQERETLWLKAQGVTEFIESLRTLIVDGKVANSELEMYKNHE